jgi:hypothetical protein
LFEDIGGLSMIKAKKRAYTANCVQWVGDVSELRKFGEVSLLNGWAMVRSPQGLVSLAPNDWLVIGENGVAKTYTDEVFKVKYEEVPQCG